MDVEEDDRPKEVPIFDQTMSILQMIKDKKVCLLFKFPDFWSCALHGSYKWIIMLEKYGRPDLNGFHLKWIIGTHGNWKNQNPGWIGSGV